MKYSWPGNVRQLQNVIEYALHLTDGHQTIQNDHLPPKIIDQLTETVLSQQFLPVEEYTKQTILALHHNHTEERIADILGISRKNLWEKRKRWNLPRPIHEGSSKATT